MKDLERALDWIQDEIDGCCDGKYVNNGNGYSECQCLQYPCSKIITQRLLKGIDTNHNL